MFVNLRRLVIENGRLKLIALAMAVAIWFYANGQLRDSTSFLLPLRFELPEGYVLLHQSSKTAALRVQGPRYLVEQVATEVDRGMHALTKQVTAADVARSEHHEFRIQAEWIASMSEHRFARLRFDVLPPGTVDVWVSRVVSRKLPVAVAVSPQSTKTRTRTTEPQEVTVTGPELLLDQMENVPTVRLEVLRDMYQLEDLRQEATLQLSDEIEINVPFRTDPPRVRVRIEVTRLSATRTLEGLPVRLLQPPPGFPYEVELEDKAQTVAITFNGPTRDVEALTRKDVRALVDVETLGSVPVPPGEERPSTERVVPFVDRDDLDVTVTSTVPARVNVRLTNPNP